MGDNLHGEKTVSTSNNEWMVDNAPPDMVVSYRQTYITGVYSDPKSEAAADESSMVAAEEVFESAEAIDQVGCPCASTGL